MYQVSDQSDKIPEQAEEVGDEEGEGGEDVEGEGGARGERKLGRRKQVPDTQESQFCILYFFKQKMCFFFCILKF